MDENLWQNTPKFVIQKNFFETNFYLLFHKFPWIKKRQIDIITPRTVTLKQFLNFRKAGSQFCQNSIKIPKHFVSQRLQLGIFWFTSKTTIYLDTLYTHLYVSNAFHLLGQYVNKLYMQYIYDKCYNRQNII